MTNFYNSLLANAKVISTVSSIIAILSLVTPIIPQPWSIVVAAFAVFLGAVFHVTSHTEASLQASARR